jgi:hypothetical protein
MIKFKIEGEQYFLPEFINIDNYVKIFKVKDLFQEDYFAAKIINITTGAPLSDLLEGEFEPIAFLAAKILGVLPKMDDVKFVDRFNLNGVDYGFFPDWKDLTFAEFMDLDTISNKPVNELLDMLHYLAAIMYRPIVSEISTHNYQIEPYEVMSMKARAELFKKELDVRYVLGAQIFFMKLEKASSNFIPQFSTQKKLSFWKQIKIIWKAWRMVYKIASKKSSDGTLLSIELRKMMLQNIK